MDFDDLRPFEALAIAIALLERLESDGILTLPTGGIGHVLDGLREAFMEVVNNG